jgi:hypothetical protein
MVTPTLQGGNRYAYEGEYYRPAPEEETKKSEVPLAKKLEKKTFAEGSVLMIELADRKATLTLLYDGPNVELTNFSDDFGVLHFTLTPGTHLEKLENASIFLVACATPATQGDNLVGSNENYTQAALRLKTVLTKKSTSGGVDITYLASDTKRAVEAANFLRKYITPPSPIHLFPCIHHLGAGQRDGDMSTWKGFMQPLNRSLYREALKMKKPDALEKLVEGITTIDEVSASFYDTMYNNSKFHCRNTNFFNLLAQFQATSLAKIQEPPSAEFQSHPPAGGTKRSRRTKRQNKNKSKRKRRYFTRNTRS